MAIGHEDAAVRGYEHIIRGVEDVIPFPGHPGGAEGHEHFALGAEFPYLVASGAVAAGIRDPDVAFRIHKHAVGPGDEAGAEALQELAVEVELEDWIEIFLANAAVLFAAVRDPHRFSASCFNLTMTTVHRSKAIDKKGMRETDKQLCRQKEKRLSD